MSIEQFADDIVASVQGYVRRAVGQVASEVKSFGERLGAFEERLKGLPADLSQLKGEPGLSGEAGKDGKDGQDGKDAEPVDFAAVVSEVAKMIPTPKDGHDGKDGPSLDQIQPLIAKAVADQVQQIPPPKNGADGKDGKSVTADDVLPILEKALAEKVSALPPAKDGRDGQDGNDGKDGRDGTDGAKGDPGESGRDALQIDILEGIDSLKRYQRGTFASYRGGIVRSFRPTDPLPEDGELERSGWHVVVRGVSDMALECEADLRTWTVKVAMTDGQNIERRVKMPVVIDRRVWKEGAYEKGDGVTWAGCYWIAQTDTTGKPGDGDQWRLAVKRGRDGKDGEKGDPGKIAIEPARVLSRVGVQEA